MAINGVTAARPAGSVPGLNLDKTAQDLRENEKSSPLPPFRESAEKLIPALEKLNKTAPIFDFRFHFIVHEETKRIIVQIIDQETGEVLNEIPPKKVLDLVARIRELVGLLVDEKR
jgi:flagellar protein FlaG